MEERVGERMKKEKETSEQELQIQSLTWKPVKERDAILKEITGVFEEGGFYGILGPNGSGKTSLIRHLLRFLESKEGAIVFANKDLQKYGRNELAKKMAFVPQNTSMDVTFSVEEIVAMGRTPHQSRFASLRKADYELIEEAMRLTNTLALREQAFDSLSGGEAQRVLIARAIAQQTKWLILDEPISHLDIRHQVDLMKTLKKLNEEMNTTVIAILHDLNLTAAYCKKVVLMKEGAIYAEGQMREVLTPEHLAQVYEMEFEVQEQENDRITIMPIL